MKPASLTLALLGACWTNFAIAQPPDAGSAGPVFRTVRYEIASPADLGIGVPPLIAQAPVIADQPPILASPQSPTAFAPTALPPTALPPVVTTAPGCTCPTLPGVGWILPQVTNYPSATRVPPAPGLSPAPASQYVGRGVIGQPKLYVEGQPLRNLLRYLTP